MGDSTAIPNLLIGATPTLAATATALRSATHLYATHRRTTPRRTTRPRTIRLRTTRPHTAEPHTTDPGTTHPHTDQPHTTDPRTTGPHLTHPPTVEPRTAPPHLAPPHLARATTACALLSLATSAVQPFMALGSGWKLSETALLLLLITLTTRYAPLRDLRTALPPAALAVCAWPLPLISGSLLEHVGVGAFWLLPALAAAASGAYPRRQEHRRRHAVATARRTQRLQLSRDLHDFVAHDISGIIVQAQAARFVAPTDPHQAILALERIEKAGLNALASMDRTLTMLHGDDASTTDALPGLPQLPTLVEEFSSAGGTQAHLHLDLPPDTAEALSRESGAAAYRIVIEALTNIRRHAPQATRADITLTTTPTTLELTVTNDHSTRPTRTAKSRGGHGLPALTEHAHALGGTLSAGPYNTTDWRLTAVLPLLSRLPQLPRLPHKESATP